ncbi:MAG: beta-lactamase, partial [Xanthobacteraceae bacterium]|nr:beta-lactamase [Xanthobacteraceae bacterium]
MEHPAPFVVTCGPDGALTGDTAAGAVPWWSFTKTCLAACALRLVAERRLTLDTPLTGRSFTLRHLLQHTSGLRDYGGLPAYHAAVAARAMPWTDDEFLTRIRHEDLLFAPGDGWAYSNVGYMLVRRLIENVTGMTLDAALRATVFGPLGIEDVRVAERPEDLKGGAWDDSRYHPGWVSHGLLIGPPKSAAMVLHGLMTKGLLPPILLGMMCKGRALDVPLEGRPWLSAGYGLGVMIPGVKGGECIGHSGEGPGSVMAAYYFPDASHDVTVAAFMRSDNAGVIERIAVDS